MSDIQDKVKNLIDEIENDKMPLSTVYKKAFSIANTTADIDALSWIKMELNGYPSGEELPEYRYLHGEVKFKDEYGRNHSIGRSSEKQNVRDDLEKMNYRESLAEIEENYQKSQHNSLIHFYPPGIQGYLRERSEQGLDFYLEIQSTSFTKLLNGARLRLLEWMHTLDGEEMDSVDIYKQRFDDCLIEAKKIQTTYQWSAHVGGYYDDAMFQGWITDVVVLLSESLGNTHHYTQEFVEKCKTSNDTDFDRGKVILEKAYKYYNNHKKKDLPQTTKTIKGQDSTKEFEMSPDDNKSVSDKIQNHPVIALIIIACVIIPATWGTLHAVIVKPKNDRMLELKEDFDRLEKNNEKLEEKNKELTSQLKTANAKIKQLESKDKFSNYIPPKKKTP